MEPLNDDQDALIFVSIVAYRDFDTANTVRSLLERAKHARRVKIAILWQYHPNRDATLMLGPMQPSPQVQQIFMSWKDARGPIWARYILQKCLYRGEKFALQIDAHMRFVKDWDEILIVQLREACSMSTYGKAVITSYPPDFGDSDEPSSEEIDAQNPVLVMPTAFHERDQLVRFNGKQLAKCPDRPILIYGWAAGFSFSRGALIEEVPYDPLLKNMFFGEEVSFAVRLYTHGYDVFCPTRNIAFHKWSRKGRPSFREVLNCDEIHRVAAEVSRQVVLHMLRSRCMTSLSAMKAKAMLISYHNQTWKPFELLHRPFENSSEIDENELNAGFGTLRSIEQFEHASGIDFKRMTVCNDESQASLFRPSLNAVMLIMSRRDHKSFENSH